MYFKAIFLVINLENCGKHVHTKTSTQTQEITGSITSLALNKVFRNIHVV